MPNQYNELCDSISKNNQYKELCDSISKRFNDGPAGKEWQFDVSEGDGNQGEHHRCSIMAVDAFEALKLAHKHGYIRSPWDVRITKDMDGDAQSAYVASYVSPIYGDACRWTASASLAITAENQN